MKTKKRSWRNRKKQLSETYKRQIINKIIRLSRNETTEPFNFVRPIKKGDKLLQESHFLEDSMLGRGLWLNMYAYQEGYAGAAIKLLDLIRLSNNNAVKDSFIIVALFCFRHYLELSMKDTILHAFSEQDMMGYGHNLNELYNKILTLPGVCEVDTTLAVQNIINTLQGYDPSGTTFRYPYIVDNAGKIKTSMRFSPQLKDVRALRTRMLQLYDFFDGINSMVHNS